jgi:hypothetical protein
MISWYYFKIIIMRFSIKRKPTFVAQNAWPSSFRVLSRKSVGISVAYAGSDHFNTNFAFLRGCDLDFFNG